MKVTSRDIDDIDVGVVIPARDEGDRIGDAVASVVDACRFVGSFCSIIVVDDASSDDTAAVAEEALAAYDGHGVVVRVRAGTAGLARARGAEVFGASVGRPDAAWLLSTDADSIVPRDWVSRYLDHARAGTVAVAGTVELLDDDDGRRVGPAWWGDYGATIAPDRTHPHVHAANLGVRLDVYRGVGGFADLARAEDIDLWRRLRADGYQPVADADIVVATSARLTGRVEVGFAAALLRLYG